MLKHHADLPPICRNPASLYALRILAVDDDPGALEALSEALGTLKIEVQRASSGSTALELALEHQPDVILLDVMMPDLDGFDVLGRIREQSTIPVIMLTAKGEEDDRVRGLELGADDYVTKPFGSRELSSRVRAVMRRAEMPSASPEEAILKIDVKLTRFSIVSHILKKN